MENRIRVVAGLDVVQRADELDDSSNDFLADFEPVGRATFFTWFCVVAMGAGCIMVGFAALSAWARVYPL